MNWVFIGQRAAAYVAAAARVDAHGPRRRGNPAWSKHDWVGSDDNPRVRAAAGDLADRLDAQQPISMQRLRSTTSTASPFSGVPSVDDRASAALGEEAELAADAEAGQEQNRVPFTRSPKKRGKCTVNPASAMVRARPMNCGVIPGSSCIRSTSGPAPLR